MRVVREHRTWPRPMSEKATAVWGGVMSLDFGGLEGGDDLGPDLSQAGDI